jgi:hypothetical protein
MYTIAMTMLAIESTCNSDVTMQAVESTALRFAISKPYLMISQIDANSMKLVKVDVVQRIIFVC